MKIKHNDIGIVQDDPFANCKLERKKYADVLTSIIKTYADGFVLAINNEWGTGKTTFVKMWEQQLKNHDYKTLYFNAWENDFESSPLVAIMAELKTLTDKKNTDAFKSLLKKGAILSKSLIPSLIKAVADKYIDTDVLVDAIENTAKASLEIFEDEIKEYTSKKQSLKEFRDEMKNFLDKTRNGTPIIFIIDELDRCKPSYAVEVLEQVKHFFSVPGIVFILAIDKIQLGHAIKGAYGSDYINTEEYLRRFIDVEYSIPAPNTNVFCKYLFDYFQFDDFFYSENRKKNSAFSGEKASIISIAALLFEKNNLTLRQQEKLLVHARIALNYFEYNQFLYPNLFLFLVFARTFYKDLYKKIELKTITLQELADEFYSVVFESINEENKSGLIHLQAELLSMYYNYFKSYNSEKLMETDKSGNEYSVIKSKIDNSENNGYFLQTLKSVTGDWNKGRTSIEFLLKKINLIDEVLS